MENLANWLQNSRSKKELHDWARWSKEEQESCAANFRLIRSFFSGLLTDRGSSKGPPPYNLSHMSYNYETWRSCNFPKENLKNMNESRHTSLQFCWHQRIFYRKPANFAISRNTFSCIISCFFYFFWVFKESLKKHGYNFDDIIKNWYSKPS